MVNIKINPKDGNNYANKLDIQNANKRICKWIADGTPFSVIRTRAEDPIIYKRNNRIPLDIRDLRLLFMNAGLYPYNNQQVIRHFITEYENAYKTMDIFCYHSVNTYELYEHNIKKYNPQCIKSNYKLSQFPLNIQNSWIHQLANKKVLVVSPFDITIAKQHKKGIGLPKSKLIIYKAVQSIAGNKVHNSWIESLNIMKNDISKLDFDIAIIGCGAYTAPLCAYIKKIGKQAIQLGGGMNIIFKIISGRYKSTDPDWVHCDELEKPKNYMKIEKGCYW